MKKSTLILTFAFAFMFFGCSEKNVTHSEPEEEKSVQDKSVQDKSVQESLAEDLLAEFQDSLESWNACVVYNGKEYTSLEDFQNRDK